MLRTLSKLLVLTAVCSCSDEPNGSPSPSDLVMNEIFVTFHVDSSVKGELLNCPGLESKIFREIGDGVADAKADIELGVTRLLNTDSPEMLGVSYHAELFECIGEFPPADGIWRRMEQDPCVLIQDISDRANSYAMNYNRIMMLESIIPNECK